MTPSAYRLQALLQKLRPWKDYIQRCTGAKVEFKPLKDGEFSVELSWKNKDGTSGEFKKSFTAEYCFGHTYKLTPMAWTVQQKPCEYARSLVREVLRVRGVL